MRNDSGMEKPCPSLPALSVAGFNEQIPTILNVVPFFHSGIRSAPGCEGKMAENTYFPEDKTMFGSPADSSRPINWPSNSTKRASRSPRSAWLGRDGHGRYRLLDMRSFIGGAG